jgi:hypothetical protein
MNNTVLQLKIKERLNKLASLDYDNFECWQIAEAFNKAQIEWVRTQVHGHNTYKEGDESSRLMIDDLQLLIKESPLTYTSTDEYFETELIPADYLYYKRFDLKVIANCCPTPALMLVYLAEQANVNNLLTDSFRNPSYKWGETFAVLGANRARVFKEADWQVDTLNLVYYRKPREVVFTGCVNLNTGAVSAVDVTCEFKDDIAELIVEGACAILAGDIESMNQYQRAASNLQRNN